MLDIIKNWYCSNFTVLHIPDLHSMFVSELMMYLLPRISLIQNRPSLNDCDYQTGKIPD